ncbi:MAG: AmmeMemoRadiSam system protein B [Candidatus Krumholzibacteriota bacterium]|nr:AmmeMemoRadiSam system protein B [Candidatus Krumholzibacteriota bacterium]
MPSVHPDLMQAARRAAGFMAVAALALGGSRGPVPARAETAGVRPPAVAGRFYPAEAGRAEAAVRAFLADAVPGAGEAPLCLLAPHAGWIYSGQVAADAWARAAGHDYEIIVILGTNHTDPGFTGVSIWPDGGYRTPLGVARVDAGAARALAARDPAFTFRRAVHEREHSVEVQLPFAQVLFPGAEYLLAVVGDADPDLCARLGRALDAVLAGRSALVVASSDLSHYPAYEDAFRVDCCTLRALASLDPERFRAALREGRRAAPAVSTCACGEAPALAMLAWAAARGAKRAEVLSYANSGHALLGDRGRCVGYGALAVTAGAGPGDVGLLAPLAELEGKGAVPMQPLSRGAALGAGPSGEDGMAYGERISELPRPRPAVTAEDGAAATPGAAALGADERRWLLGFARSCIRRYLETGTAPLPRSLPPCLAAGRGVFVTLEDHGRLRGCIGYMAEDLPVAQSVGRAALQAAFEDRRFPPVTADELDGLTISISLLTPMRPVDGPGDIVLGRDGIVLEKGGRRAVYLPQVAPEQGWTLEETLSHLAEKAGLDADAWRRGARFQTFQAEVFGESGKGE